MRVVCIAGPPDTREFALAIHVAVMAKRTYPPFHFKTTPVAKERFQAWTYEACCEEMWEQIQEAVLTWYEVGCPGGPKVLIGGLFSYLEYMRCEYGVSRDISLSQIDRIVDLKQEEMRNFERYKNALKSVRNIFVISIVAAGSNRATPSVIYSLLRLKGVRIADGLIIRLFDRFEENYSKLEEIQKKFNIIENRMGYGFVKIVKSFQELVKDCDILIFLGDNFRTEGMDVEKYLYKERVLYGVYGVLCNKYLPKKTKVLFAAMENSCFNATSFLDRGVSVNQKNLAVVTGHLASEVRSYISQVGGFPVERVVKIPVWGMADMSHVVDVAKGQLIFRYPDLDRTDFPNFEALMEKCDPGMKLFLRLVMTQKEARDAERELSDMEDVLRRTYDKYFESEEALRQNLQKACDIQTLADEGGDLAKIAMRDIWEEILKMNREGKMDFVKLNKDERSGEAIKKQSVNEKLPETNNLPPESDKKDEEVVMCDEAENLTGDKKLRSRLEIRSLKYILNSLRNMWDFLGVAKNAVRKRIGQDPFISQVRELENVLQIWVLDPLRKNEVIFLGIVSDGGYGLPRGMVLSQPASLSPRQEWEVYLEQGREDLKPSSKSGPEGFQAVLSLASLVLKHFIISPETETVDDLVEKNLNDMDYVDWRLEKLQAEHEYNELSKMNTEQYDQFESDWLKHAMYGEGGLPDEGKKDEQTQRDYKKREEDYPEGGECQACSGLSRYLQEEERVLVPEGDEQHRQYLRSVGFLKEEGGHPALGREYDQLIRKAFMELFCKDDMKSEGVTEEESTEKFPTNTTSNYEGFGVGAEEIERPIHNFIGETYADDIPIRHGIGAELDLEDDINTGNLINTVVMNDFSTLPKIDEKHEYDKSYTRKQGFPLNFQGKVIDDVSTIYKDLLLVDAETIKECFESLASRVDEEYEEKLYNESTSQNEDRSETIEDYEQGNNFSPEKTSTENELRQDGAMIREEMTHNGINGESDSQEEVLSSKSFTFPSTSTDTRSGDKTPSFTIHDPPPEKRERGSECSLDIWRAPEGKDPTDELPDIKLFVKAALLGALRAQVSNEKAEMRGKATQKKGFCTWKGQRSQSCGRSQGERGIVFRYQGSKNTMSRKKLEKEVLQTQQEIKAGCSSFTEFIEKFRKNNVLYDLYEGIADPELSPFPKKTALETYVQFKSRCKSHARNLLRSAVERAEIIKKTNLKHYEALLQETAT